MFSRRSCKLRLCNSAIESLNNREKERKRERGGERVREREREEEERLNVSRAGTDSIRSRLQEQSAQGRRRLSISLCQPRRLSASYPTLLLSRSCVPFRDGNYDRSNERASVSNSSSLHERTRLALAISPRKTTERKREKRKSPSGRSWKKDDRVPEAPLRIIIMRLSRGAKRTLDRASI